MSELTKVRIRLTDGLEVLIFVSDFAKFEEDVKFRNENTIFKDEKSGLNVFAMAVSTFKKEE